ncbi:beta-glucosidase BglX [Sphingobium tyrosinilyticum]|uniref:beta-glucosidase BglX n=1 Tax=Sphingobium tyrosinilyticum TaxID=2715436 RepID=UPI0036D3D15F
MTNSLRRALAAGACFAALSGAPAVGQAPAPTSSIDEAVKAKADTLIAQMTPEEKAGQLTQFFYFAQFPSNGAVEKAIEAGGMGSVLFVTDPSALNRLQKIAMEKSRLKIPLLFGFDVIHGLHTIFPVPIGLAASWDPSLVEKAQAAAAAEARAVGLHWTFAPMIDVARDARWGRMVEGAGEDPYLGAVMAAAQVRGFQGRGLGQPDRIISGPKHFVGYGASYGGRDYDEVNLSDSELWNVYLPPFKAAIDAGAANIMSAYMGVNGVPAAANPWLLSTLLREKLGFKGFVVSDNQAVQNLVTQHFAADREDAAARAVSAGLDMEMNPPMSKAAMSSLPDALKTGKVSQAQVDAAVRRVLEAKIRMGLFEHPYVDESLTEKRLNDPAHLALARSAAARSAVLLRNENGLLPLDRKGVKSIAVIGPMADSERDTLGPWVFPQNNPKATTVLAGLKAKFGPAVRVDYSEGVRMPQRAFTSPFATLDPRPKLTPIDPDAEFKRAVDLASKADVAVLVLGEAFDMIGEVASRSDFSLPGRQQELLDAVVATGKPVVVVLMNARPLDLKDSKVAAILEAWYPGSAGGDAVADLLVGDAAPGGKLPFSWIRSAGQAPYTYSFLVSHDPTNANKRYWNESNKPIWPFGHGLSYTQFSYGNLQVEKPTYGLGEAVRVSVDLTNRGKRVGEEVAQLYVHQRYGSAARPVRELKGFQRVSLKPGQTRTLRFVLKPEDLRYWSAASQGWVQDETKFDLWVGGNSDADLAGSFEVRGK